MDPETPKGGIIDIGLLVYRDARGNPTGEDKEIVFKDIDLVAITHQDLYNRVKDNLKV